MAATAAARPRRGYRYENLVSFGRVKLYFSFGYERLNHGMRCVCGLKQVFDARMAADGQRNETIRGDGYGGGDDSDVKINLGSRTSTDAAPRHPPLTPSSS